MRPTDVLHHRVAAGLAALGTLLLTTGCATGPSQLVVTRPVATQSADTQQATGCRPLDADVLHQEGYDYDPVRSVSELLQAHDGAVVLGRVDGFTEGLRRHVLMRIAVDEVLREGAPGVVQAGVAHAYFWRGGTVAGTGRPHLGAGDFSRAVPRGTRVLALLSPARPALQRRATLPEGAVLGETRVQGLYLDGCDRLVGGHDYAVAEGSDFRDLGTLVAAVRRLTG